MSFDKIFDLTARVYFIFFLIGVPEPRVCSEIHMAMCDVLIAFPNNTLRSALRNRCRGVDKVLYRYDHA